MADDDKGNDVRGAAPVEECYPVIEAPVIAICPELQVMNIVMLAIHRHIKNDHAAQRRVANWLADRLASARLSSHESPLNS